MNDNDVFEEQDGLKHTPGPWSRFDNGGTRESGHEFGREYAATIWGPKGPGHGAIAKCGHRATDEAIANAQLISAAPDLLEALKEILPMAELGAAKPGHEGPCGPWASCDCECVQAAHDSESLWKAGRAIRKAEGK